MGLDNKKKAVISIATAPLIGWLGLQVYEMRQEVTEARTRIEAMQEVQKDNRDSINELISLHLQIKFDKNSNQP